MNDIHRNMANVDTSVYNGGDLGSYFTPGSFRKARLGIIAGIFGPVMWHAGKAAKRAGYTPKQIALHAAYCGMRWKAWSFTVLMWFLGVFFWGMDTWLRSHPRSYPAFRGRAAYTNPTEPIGVQLMMLVALAAVLVPSVGVGYCQAVAISGFKRRWLFRVLTPFYKVMGRLHWMVVLSLVLAPNLILAFGGYKYV